jgi:glycosyltransferase involved in cell wall biosynthesis
MKHRLSVVIPVRNRAETLLYTLRTCVAQEFDDCEIVVSDNDSSSAVRQVVGGFADRRIRYVRTPALLAMSDSWEFALAQASGEYVTFLGADDGLLPHALPEIDRLLRMLDPPALRWESVCYNWPDLPAQDQAAANELLIPLKQFNYYHAIHRRSAAALIPDAVNCRTSYAELPTVYCSAIHHTLVEQLRARTGRVFQSQSPDVYSGFAFGCLAGAFLSLTAPMNVSALSAQSNGVACVYLKGKSPIAQEFRSLNRGLNASHPQASDLPVMSAGIADSYLRAREALFPEAPSALDRRQLVHRCLQEGRAGDADEWRRVLDSLRRSLADDPALRAWFDEMYGRLPFEAFVRTPTPRLKRYGGVYLHLDASDFGVTNVHEAALFCEKLLGYKRDGINAHLAPESAAA